MNDGKDLQERYHEPLLQYIKQYYLVLRIFSIWIFGLCCAGLLGFTVSFFTDEAYSSGLYASIPAMKWIMFGICLLIIGGLVWLSLKLVMLPIKKIRAVKNGNFTWRFGTLTEFRFVDHKSKLKTFVDGEPCLTLGLSQEDRESIHVGDTYILIYLGKKNPLKFTMKA